jgi:hypothetical protein
MSNITVQELAATFLARAEELESQAKELRSAWSLLLVEIANKTSAPAFRTKFVIWHKPSGLRSMDHRYEYTTREDAEANFTYLVSIYPHLRENYEVREVLA